MGDGTFHVHRLVLGVAVAGVAKQGDGSCASSLDMGLRRESWETAHFMCAVLSLRAGWYVLDLHSVFNYL